MSWYYASGGQQQGPVDDAQFEALIQAGQIKPADLVWKEGMANWQPLSTVRPGTGAPPLTPGAPPVIGGAAAAGAGAGASSPNEIVCVECGGRFTKDNAIQYGTTWVCASCKPSFVQKLKEGANLGPGSGPGAMQYAGFWIRLGAKIIDGLIFSLILAIPVIAMILPIIKSAGRGGPGPEVGIMFQVVIQLSSIVVAVAYNTFFIGKFGATPGKMAVGVKVVTAEGAPLTWGRAFGRAWADQLSSLLCSIGYIIAAFDSEKRALHDHICSTRVIYK